MVEHGRDVIHVPGHGGRPVDGGDDLEFRSILVQHVLGRLYHGVRPFIQPDAGLVQPSLALDMLFKGKGKNFGKSSQLIFHLFSLLSVHGHT